MTKKWRKKEVLEPFTKEVVGRLQGTERYEALKQYHDWLKRSRQQDVKEATNIRTKKWRTKNIELYSIIKKIQYTYSRIEVYFVELEELHKRYDKIRRRRK